MPIFEITVTVKARIAAPTDKRAAELAILALMSDEHKNKSEIIDHKVLIRSKNCGPSSDELLEEARQMKLFEGEPQCT